MLFSDFIRRHRPLVALAVPLFIYGSTKAPRQQQCDFRPSGESEVTDGALNYFRYAGDDATTNISLAVCGGALTNDFAFAKGQFYFEQRLFPSADHTTDGLWFRDSETNDWIAATIDSRPDVGPEWFAAFAHITDWAEPLAYRFWFFGPEENLPAKVVEGGVGITITGYFRTSRVLHVEFTRDDPALAGVPVVLSVRQVYVVPDGGQRVLGQWADISTTTGDSFTVEGNFVQYYNEVRLYADKEVTD